MRENCTHGSEGGEGRWSFSTPIKYKAAFSPVGDKPASESCQSMSITRHETPDSTHLRVSLGIHLAAALRVVARAMHRVLVDERIQPGQHLDRQLHIH